jgi:hypothetical protein
MMLKSLKYQTWILAMMLKIFHISSPNGGLDLHFAQGYCEGDVETFPYIQ